MSDPSSHATASGESADARQGGELRLKLLGVSVDLVCDEPAAYDLVRSGWSRCLDPDPKGEAKISIRASASDPFLLASNISRLAIGQASKRQLVFQAAGVAVGNQVTCLVGDSGSGKTTAVSVLARSSFGYVAEDVVAVGKGGDVAPCPQPLFTNTSRGERQERSLVEPDELHLQSFDEPLRLARLVLLDRRNEKQSADLAPMGLIDALLALIPRTSNLTRRPHPLQQLCRVLGRCGGLLRATYGDAAQLEEALLGLLSSSVQPIEEWTGLPAGRPRPWALTDGRVRQAAWRDAISVGDEVLLLIDRTPVRVSGIGLTVWEAAAEAPTLSEVTEAVVDEHGPHPDATTLVRRAIESMVDAGVLGFGVPRTLEDHLAMCKAEAEALPLQGRSGQSAL